VEIKTPFCLPLVVILWGGECSSKKLSLNLSNLNQTRAKSTRTTIREVIISDFGQKLRLLAVAPLVSVLLMLLPEGPSPPSTPPVVGVRVLGVVEPDVENDEPGLLLLLLLLVPAALALAG